MGSHKKSCQGRPVELSRSEFSVIQRFLCKRIFYSDPEDVAEEGTDWTMVIPDPWKLVLALSPKAAGPFAIEFYLAIHVCIDTPLGLKRNSNPISNPGPYLTFDADSSFTSVTTDPTRLDMALFWRGHDFGGSKHPQVRLTLREDSTFGMTTMLAPPVPLLSYQHSTEDTPLTPL